jgi:uncharacterized protein
MTKSNRVQCPICRKENEFFSEPVGPFCSPRCKLVDLGKWLGEEYRVSEPLSPEHFAAYEDAPEAELDRPELD